MRIHSLNYYEIQFVYYYYSHGIGRLKPIYFDRIAKGILKPFAPIDIIRETATTALVDGNLGLGLYVGPYW